MAAKHNSEDLVYINSNKVVFEKMPDTPNGEEEERYVTNEYYAPPELSESGKENRIDQSSYTSTVMANPTVEVPTPIIYETIAAPTLGTTKKPSTKNHCNFCRILILILIVIIAGLIVAIAILANKSVKDEASVSSQALKHEDDKRELVVEVKQLETKVGLREAKVADLEKQVQDLHIKLNESKTEMQDLRDKLNSSETKVRDLQGKVNSSMSEVQDLNAKLDEKEIEMRDLHVKVNNSNAQVEDLHTKLNKSKVESKDLRNKLNSSKTEVLSLHVKLDETVMEVKELHMKLNNSKVEVQSLYGGVNNSKLEVQDLHVKLNKTKMQVQDLYVKLNDSKTEVHGLHLKLNKTEVQVQDLRGKMNSSKAEVEGLHVKLNQTKEQVHDLRGKVNNSKAEVQGLHVKLNKKVVEVHDLNVRLNQSVLERHDLQNKLNRSEAKVQVLLTKLNQKEVEFAELSKNASNLKCEREIIETERIVMGKTSFGDWSDTLMCDGRVTGFRLRVEGVVSRDNTALNGIQLKCSNGKETAQIKGHFGGWGEFKTCGGGSYINGFNFRSEAHRGGARDDTGGTDVKMRCTDNVELHGDGLDRGGWEFPTYQECPLQSYLCGVQAKVESDGGVFTDDTGLNQMKFVCCNSNVFTCSCIVPSLCQYNTL